VDEELQRARSEHLRDPADRAAARAFEAALARAGRTDELVARFSQAFTCRLTWQDFEPTVRAVRACTQCKREVTLLGPDAGEAAAALARAATSGACVAASSAVRTCALAVAAGAPGELLFRDRDPCFVVDLPPSPVAGPPRPDMTEREFWAIHGPKWPSDYDD
jgi:hypothetical protein